MRQVLCPVLVAREDETRQVEAALAGARAGRGGTVLVTGEAGVGKSRLVREAARAAAGASRAKIRSKTRGSHRP